MLAMEVDWNLNETWIYESHMELEMCVAKSEQTVSNYECIHSKKRHNACSSFSNIQTNIIYIVCTYIYGSTECPIPLACGNYIYVGT
jgi:hypothetical protein